MPALDDTFVWQGRPWRVVRLDDDAALALCTSGDVAQKFSYDVIESVQVIPEIASLQPNFVYQDELPAHVVVTGRYFDEDAIVTVYGAPQTTTYVDPTMLEVDLRRFAAGELPVLVMNGDGATSNDPHFTVAAREP